jgi:hypothetical protein
MLAIMLLTAQPVRAAPENITDGELALLPPYCQDVQAIRWGNASFNPSPRAGYWVSLMGQTFWALHHYCWGLIHVRRSEAPGLPPILRTGMLNTAINDYFYVINNGPRDFVLAPEIYLRIGEARLSLGQIGLAHDAFRIARELKPDYWPAYTRWIDHLVRTNQKPAAKDLAAEGLRVAPDSQELQDRFRKLGGDPSKVSPAIIATAGPVESAAAKSQEPSKTGEPPNAAAAPSAAASSSLSASSPDRR